LSVIYQLFFALLFLQFKIDEADRKANPRGDKLCSSRPILPPEMESSRSLSRSKRGRGYCTASVPPVTHFRAFLNRLSLILRKSYIADLNFNMERWRGVEVEDKRGRGWVRGEL